jgi:PleD family two-component response regulator
MPAMMTQSKKVSGKPFAAPKILLASDSERHGSTIHRALEQYGFAVEFAGDYARVDSLLRERDFDVVLLEVTGQHAVELAVAAALRVKRGNAGQFVGYLADASLETSGLAGDAVFPRNAARLQDALRRAIADSAE